MKILVLSPFLYHSKVGHGGGVACVEQLRMLAPHHEIHFLSFITHESDEELSVARAELLGLCRSVHTVKLGINKVAVLKAKLKFLFRLAPIDAELFDSAEMQQKLQALIASEQPDVVFIQFPQMAQYVAYCAGAATAMDVQDAFSVSSFRKFRTQTTRFKKLGMFFNWISWLLYEARFYPAFDSVAAVTDQDRIGLEIFSPGLGAEVIKAAISLDDSAAPDVMPETIGFIGSFSHYPNVEGVRFFIQHVLPAIVLQRPHVRLMVAGGNPPQQLLDLANKNVEFLGFVPDANTFMRSNTLMVVPLLSGGGVKIKTLHAMACACPMVTTSIGAEEIGIVDGEHALIADTAAEFAIQVQALLENPVRASRLGANARSWVTQYFSWDAKAASAERVLRRAHSRGQERLSKANSG